MSKYVIKNCPAYDCSITEWDCLGSDATECKDGNCILKQIVELCKDAQCECSCSEPNKDVDCFECTSGGRAELGTDILKLLDIQEVK